MTDTISPSEPYLELSRRLRQLHALIRIGEGDSDEAESLRDEMDTYYTRLTADEVGRLNLLSEDLNKLAEILESGPSRSTDDAVRRQLIEAEQHANFDGYRDLLKSHDSVMSKVDALLFRSIYWAALEDFESGLEFLDGVVAELENERTALDAEAARMEDWFEGLPSESISLADRLEIDRKVSAAREAGMRLRQSIDVLRGQNGVLKSLIESLNLFGSPQQQALEINPVIKRVFADVCLRSSAVLAA